MSAPKNAGNAGKRNSHERKRFVLINGEKKLVTPVLYGGSRAGHGNYMAGYVDGKTYDDKDGRPVPFKQIGFLDFA